MIVLKFTRLEENFSSIFILVNVSGWLLWPSLQRHSVFGAELLSKQFDFLDFLLQDLTLNLLRCHG